MAQLQGQSGGDGLTGRTTILPLQGSMDLVAPLTARTDINVPLSGTFGVGFSDLVGIITIGIWNDEGRWIDNENWKDN